MAKRTNSYKKDANYSIIKSNLEIKEFLYKRFTDNGLMFLEVMEEAAKNNIKIDAGQISRYLSTNYQVQNGLSEEMILHLCKRYGIDVRLEVKYLSNFKL